MGRQADSIWSAKVFQRSLHRWRQAADRAQNADLPRLRRQRRYALSLRYHLDRLLHIADERLPDAEGPQTTFDVPVGADWRWRPDTWRGRLSEASLVAPASGTPFGTDMIIFHDSERSEVTVRQVSHRGRRYRSCRALGLDVLGFDGSFLSASLDLPADALHGLKADHVLQVDAQIETECPLLLYVRLNLTQGPNTERIVREVQLPAPALVVAFDLTQTQIEPHRIDNAWIDFIFDKPGMNAILLHDVTVCRFTRAQI